MRSSRFVLLAASCVAVLCGGCRTPVQRATAPARQVLFVCEHGNVKSLMAVPYFNQMAEQRGLSVRAVSRGTAPDSTTVPAGIAQHLQAEGYDVTAFHPTAVRAADVSASQRVVTIGVTLPTNAQQAGISLERWDDVPPASVDYGKASESLKGHVKSLVDSLSRP